MHTASRVALWTVAILAALVLLGTIAVWTFDWNRLRQPLASLLGESLGTEVAIRGDLDVGWDNGALRVRAHDIAVADAFESPPPLLALERLSAAIALRPLLRGDLVFDRVLLEHPRVSLERNADGRANWDFAELPDERAEPDARAPTPPPIEQLEVRNARLAYRDPLLEEPLNLALDEVQGRVGRDGALRAAGAGSLENRALRFDARSAPPNDEGNRRLEAEVALADARLAVDGMLAQPDLRLILDVPRPEQLDFLPLPHTAGIDGLHLATRLTRDRGQWWLDDLELTAGGRRLDGDIRLDTAPEPPMLYATLHLDALAFPAPEAREREELIPPAPVPLAALRSVDARVDLSIGRIVDAPVPINDVELLVELNGGRLALRPGAADVSGGEIEGSLVYDASRSFPSATARLAVRGINLAPVAPGTDGDVTGEVSGTIDVRTQGRDLEQLAANLDGQLLFTMRGGAVNAAWVEALDLDLAEWVLATAAPGTAQTPVRCGLIAFSARKGVLSAEPVAIDTRDSLITAEGQISLGTEELTLTLRAFPKDPSALAIEGPIRIAGSLTEPSVDVLSGEAAAQGGLALALGALAGPLAAILPFIDAGTIEDVNCAELLGDQPKASPESGRQ